LADDNRHIESPKNYGSADGGPRFESISLQRRVCKPSVPPGSIAADLGIPSVARSLCAPQINVTPMVDVMLVLLVIFMVTAPLLTVSVPLDLPKSKVTTLTEPQNPVVISLNHEGELFIGSDLAPEPSCYPGKCLLGRIRALSARDLVMLHVC
jgi:Biopolymer transport protein ExbD/TolR